MRCQSREPEDRNTKDQLKCVMTVNVNRGERKFGTTVENNHLDMGRAICKNKRNNNKTTLNLRK